MVVEDYFSSFLRRPSAAMPATPATAPRIAVATDPVSPVFGSCSRAGAGCSGTGFTGVFGVGSIGLLGVGSTGVFGVGVGGTGVFGVGVGGTGVFGVGTFGVFTSL